MSRKPLHMLQLVLLGIIVALTGCQTPTPSPSPIPTSSPMPTQTPYPTYTPYPTSTPVPTHTPFPTWTPSPTATHTPEPTATPTDTPTPTATATPTPAPATEAAPPPVQQPAASSVADVIATMHTTRQRVQDLADMIASATGTGYLDCEAWVTTVLVIDVGSQIDVSGHTQRVQDVYHHYRQGIAILMDGAAPMTEHCAKFLAGEDTKDTISFQSWGTAHIKVGEALTYIDGSINALEQEQ